VPLCIPHRRSLLSSAAPPSPPFSPFPSASAPPPSREASKRHAWPRHGRQQRSHRRASPPNRHGRRRARFRASPAMPLALLRPPWHGGHDGGNLVAGNLADGEISPLNPSPVSVCVRGGDGLTRGPLAASRVQIWGDRSVCAYQKWPAGFLVLKKMI
jgi:hypothetical protein